MDKERVKRAWLGLIVGFPIGCGLGYLFLLLTNWLSTWTKMEPVDITFRGVLPVGIVMGLSMAAVMSSYMFED